MTARALHKFLNTLPAGSTRYIGLALSKLAYVLHERSHHRRGVHAAIASALQLSPDSHEVDQLVHENFHHILQTVLEVARFDQLKKDWSKRIVVEGLEHYQQVKAKGQGVVLFSGHVGNWELLISGLPLIGIDQPYALGWKQESSEFNDLLDRQRLLWGTQILWTQDFTEAQVAEILQGGGTLYIMCDRYEQGKTKVDLFGHPTGTPAGPVLFARKYDAALMPIHTFREANKHHIVIEPPLQLKPLTPGSDLTPDMQMCMTRIETWIRQHPEQWIWLFKRGEWQYAPDKLRQASNM